MFPDARRMDKANQSQEQMARAVPLRVVFARTFWVNINDKNHVFLKKL